MMSEIVAALRWWLVLLGLGAAVTPLCWAVFSKLPSRGYPYAKMVGLLLVSYLFWVMASFGFLENTTGGIVLAAVIVVGLSGIAVVRMEEDWRDLLREQWRTILVTELLFAVLFATWAWVRAQNPSITATEKPMEFAFLNAATYSEAYPPLDPWLSGFSISYYYFGYVMTSVLTRLAAVPTATGFNLGVAWLFAGAGIGAFGVVYELVGLISREAVKEGKKKAVEWMIGLGIVAALAVPAAGNLTVILELAHGNGIGSEQFWAWLDVEDLDGAPNTEETARYEESSWWWWRTSRVIREYHLDGGESGLPPIAEVPGFSFILGDMHPHVLALPFVFLSMALALAWYLRVTDERLRDQHWATRLKAVVRNPLFVLLTAIVVGGMSFLNTWDVIIHLFLVVAAFALAQWRDNEGWSPSIVGNTVGLTAVLILGAYLLYLPFYIGFSSQASAPYLLPMMMRPTRFVHFFIIFGMPLTAIMLLMGTLVVVQKGRNWQSGLIAAGATVGILTFLLFFMGMLAGIGEPNRLADVMREVGVDAGEIGGAGWAIGGVFRVVIPVLMKRLAVPVVTLILAGIVGACVMVVGEEFRTKAHRGEGEKADSVLPFLLLLILTGALLTIGTEFVYLRDQFGQRMNTIFKFYYQAWALFGVAAVVGLYVLWSRAKIVGVVGMIAYGLMFVGAMAFPLLAVQSRQMEYRGSELTTPATLDGLAYVDADERAAVEWLRTRPERLVIVEAIKGSYDDSARIATNTGHQTLLGWEGHERQWRGDTFTQSDRRGEIETIYKGTNWDETAGILNKYAVDYVFVGNIERAEYGVEGLVKFDKNMPIVYQNSSVTIYAWQ